MQNEQEKFIKKSIILQGKVTAYESKATAIGVIFLLAMVIRFF